MAARSRSLQELFARSSVKVRQDAMTASVTFPRSPELVDDRPFVVVHGPGPTIDWDAARTAVETENELVALGAVPDLVCVLRVLEESCERMHWEQFDAVQLHRDGLDLLRVANRARNVGRSVYVDLGRYRRRLGDLPSSAGSSDHATALLAVLLGATLTGLVIAVLKCLK
ncbi:Hypothetical protein UVM_LOCUS127 [uncultured virus]|nr:Hypothetical protein UVM_LOCUS127 [uncultured virus]